MRKFIALIVVVLLVAGAWTGGWLYGASEIRAGAARLATNDGETEPKLDCGRLDITGFPFRFDIECADATLVSGDVTTTIAGVKASLLVYNPTQAKFSALGPIGIDDAYSGARSRIDFAASDGSIRLTARDFLRGFIGEGWRIGQVSLVADGVIVTDTTLNERQTLRAAHLEAHLVDAPERHDAAAGTAVLAAYVGLNDADLPELQIAEGEARFEAELSGLPDDLRALSSPEVVRAWQAAGGQLNIVGLNATSGEQFIESKGTLALDSGGRVDGQIELKSRGLVERFATLLPEEMRGLLLGGQAPDGSYAQVLNIKSGIVFSGLIPISIIPPLI